ncbi:MAG: FkbM family methyltransferase [Crocinitomicaceae bacterium]|nr:FkbM family methyltransferase [Crocinitomicaceae bacterium]
MKKAGKYLYRKMGFLVFYTLTKSGYLKDKGWFRSFKEKESVDKEGNPIPWYSYPFLDFLAPRLNDSMEVFEYGCGNSSLWFQQYVKNITACEHHEGWYDKMTAKAKDNFSLKLRPEGSDYINCISEDNHKYDIIIIDGMSRLECAFNCLNNLSERGIIIWDDSVREEYEPGYQFLLENGFKRLDFHGMTPIVELATATTVFYRSGNCLDI